MTTDGVDRLVSTIEEQWGEAITGTRRKHLREVLETVRAVGGAEAAAEVAAWTAENPPEVPLETVRLHASREHAIGRDRFGFR